MAGNAQTDSHGAHGGNHFKQHIHQVKLFNGADQERADQDTEQIHTEYCGGLCYSVQFQTALVDIDAFRPGQRCPQVQDQHYNGGDFDTAGG